MTASATEAQTSAKPAEPALVPCTLWEYTCYFLRPGTIGFGGPIALAGYMQRDPGAAGDHGGRLNRTRLALVRRRLGGDSMNPSDRSSE